MQEHAERFAKISDRFQAHLSKSIKTFAVLRSAGVSVPIACNQAYRLLSSWHEHSRCEDDFNVMLAHLEQALAVLKKQTLSANDAAPLAVDIVITAHAWA